MNVILIISDSMRRDCLGCYGAPPWAGQFKTGIGRIHTPHLDRFARSAFVFDNAYIASFPTVPTRNDILTGRYTWTYKPWEPLGEELTLPAILNHHGVLTALIADTPHPFAPGYNYQRDFQSWELIRGQENDRWRTSPEEVQWPAAKDKMRNPDQTVLQYLRNMNGRQYEESYFPARTFMEAARWLERNYDREPFFLYVDTFDPHEPWDPPQYYTDLYDPGYEGDKVIYPRYDLCDYLSEAELNHCRALYAGEITMVDHWFGYLLDRIDSLGLLKNSAVIFMSDHGFYLGEHGYIGKVILRTNFRQSIPLFPEVARIPLLIHMPGKETAEISNGQRPDSPPKRITNPVQTIDLMPTICELLDIPVPASARAPSFAPLLAGGQIPDRETVICAPTLSHSGLNIPHPTDRASVYWRSWLLVYGAQTAGSTGPGQELSHMVDSNLRTTTALESQQVRPSLYNLDQDPNATIDLLNNHRDIAEKLHGTLYRFMAEQGVPERHLKYFRTLDN